MVELNLTKRQQEIFDFIKRYVGEHGYPPTVRDIGKAIGLTSSSTVHAHLANLEKLGLLRRDPTKPRAIEVLVDKAKQVGHADAGCRSSARSPPAQPVLAEENIEEYVPVPGIAGGDEGEFVLRVKGDSMKDAGILEGDHVSSAARRPPRDGEIVVALVGERGDRQALLQGERPRAPAAGERRARADPDARRRRCSAAWSGSAGGCHERRRAEHQPARPRTAPPSARASAAARRPRLTLEAAPRRDARARRQRRRPDGARRLPAYADGHA